MQQKYIYSFNGFTHFFKGIFWPELGKQAFPSLHPTKTFVWRNHFTLGYKISDAYLQQPLDLSNHLLIRTRERMLLENKINSPQNVIKGGKISSWNAPVAEQSLTRCREEVMTDLAQLNRLIYVANEQSNLPVAFASNALYAYERNGGGPKEEYERVLLPVLRKKLEWLHAEGVSQTVWALANAEIWDSQIWEGLKKHIHNKDFNYQIVKNDRYSIFFSYHTGTEHYFEKELTPLANSIFFKDHIVLFELYNGLVKAHSLNKQLKLDETIKYLEQRYSDVLANNAAFKEIENTYNSDAAKLSQGQKSRQALV